MKNCAHCKTSISSGNYCTSCNKIRCKEYYLKNKSRKLQKQSEYSNSHKEEKRAYNKKYYENNKEVLSNKIKNYKLENKEKVCTYIKNKRKENVEFRLTCALRKRLYSTIKVQNGDKNLKFIDLIGCTSNELKSYIESKFLPTMTWENYGSYWHIDHIIPCSSFNLIDENEQKKCFHYTNLQPLFAVTQIIDGIEYIGNLNKGYKI